MMASQRMGVLSWVLAGLIAIAGAGCGTGVEDDPLQAKAPSLTDTTSSSSSANVDSRGQQLAGPLLSNFTRKVIVGDVAEYSGTVRVGFGKYDVIGLHRVVRESRPGVPKNVGRAIMMVHGDAWNFDPVFMSNATTPLPVVLAQQNIDVWGIDLRWTLVPATETDLSFMANWNLAQDINDVRLAIAIGRAVRAKQGASSGKMHLAGWSRGGWIGYSLLSLEAKFESEYRQAKTFVPLDTYIKTDDPTLTQHACNNAAASDAALAGGTYANDNGIFQAAGGLALSDPNGTSPFAPPYNNRQFALLIGMASYVGFNGNEPAPFYHFVGGTFDANNVPVGLSYSDETRFFQFLTQSSRWQPNKQLSDAWHVTCGDINLPYDDNFSSVKVPLLYVGAGGGFGEFGVYSTTLMGSTDKSTILIDFVPVPEGRIADYGHVDLMESSISVAAAFTPIANWILSH